MTEEEWMECKRPDKMFDQLVRLKPPARGKLSRFREACNIHRTDLPTWLWWGEAGTAEAHIQADVLRDIFGNPFRPISLNLSWLTPTVKQLAVAIYEQRQFDKMPLLGDALEEAGCDNEDVLQHCRGGGEHVRGCWVVDKVLGKE